MIVELKEIKELIELVAEKGFADFELQKGGFKLKLSFATGDVKASILPSNPLTPAPATELAIPIAQPSTPVTPVVAAPVKVEKELHKIKSPIVGTFYRSPSPTAEVFVKIGSRIEHGTVLCIVEAMKLMNEIESDIAGEIIEIYVENAQPVEYGQPLFGIKID